MIDLSDDVDTYALVQNKGKHHCVDVVMTAGVVSGCKLSQQRCKQDSPP